MAKFNRVKNHKSLFTKQIFESEVLDKQLIERGSITSLPTEIGNSRVQFQSKQAYHCNQTVTDWVPESQMSIVNKSLVSVDVIILKGQLSEICTISEIRRNFLCLMLLLSLGSFCFFCMNFQLKHVEGNIIDNTLASQTSELIADCLSSIVLFCVGARLSLSFSFLISLTGLIVLLHVIKSGQHDMIPVFISVAKFGVASAFNICYIVSVKLIPTLYAASVFGFCNVMARSVTIAAPVVAEIDGTTPIIINIFCVFIAFLVSFFIKEKLPKFV